MLIWWKMHFQGYKRTQGKKRKPEDGTRGEWSKWTSKESNIIKVVPVQGAQCNCSTLKYALLLRNKQSTVDSWTLFVWPCLMDLVAVIKMCGVHGELITTHSWEGHVETHTRARARLGCLWGFKGVVLLTAPLLIGNLSLHYQPPCMKEKTERFLKDTLVMALGLDELQ